MSYGIIRMQKFSAERVRAVERHDCRTISDTTLCYDIHTAQITDFVAAVQGRIQQLCLPRAVRKDAVVMAQALVTSDLKFFQRKLPAQIHSFFRDSYAFLCERYGLENIISSTVHLDEAVPHMHVNFVPVTADGRLSAKSILTKHNFSEQQTAFYKCVGQRYGLQRGEAKKKDAQKGLQEALQRLQEVRGVILSLEAEKTLLEASVGDLRGIAAYTKNLPKGKKAKIGQKIILTPDEYRQLAEAVFANRWEMVQQMDAQRRIEQLECRNRELQEENQRLKRETLSPAEKSVLPSGNLYLIRRNLDF